MSFLRSLLFALIQATITIPYGLAALLLRPLPPLTRYRLVKWWARLMMWLARRVLGIRYRVEGLEHLPHGPCVVLSKHQSAWETIAFQLFMPPLSFVLKKELLRIPFFGWGLAMTSPIAIDRNAGREALKVLETQGRERLAGGFWVLVFPEGTRVKPGERGRYNVGGAWLAVKAGVPVLPVAHNAGRLWGKNAFMKYPGEVSVIIGAPISTAGRKPAEVNAEAEAWIEGHMADL
ncbi:MAG: 1-acyl-sn-glycerol-3-phosphate acyltransferase [Thiobacillaceae bacterium]|jgi:1-acyl-sn-glycerol-3-phosphate acyltransferase|nr:1-acyl-sn-glycerol-3-phosphate acyltransferase [Thiobacillaceae bacterium]